MCFHCVCIIYGVVKTDGSQFVLWPRGMLLGSFKEEAEVLSTLFELVQVRLNVSSLTHRL